MKNSPPNVHAVNIHIFSLVHQLSIMAASSLNFCSLALPVWLVFSYVFLIEKSLFTERLKIVLVFEILTIAAFISETLPGNTPVTMAILQKCLGTFSS